MSATLTASVVLHPQDVDQITARCQTHEDGHIAVIVIAEQLELQCSGDGTRHLLALLDDMRAKVEAAHNEWREAVGVG